MELDYFKWLGLEAAQKTHEEHEEFKARFREVISVAVLVTTLEEFDNGVYLGSRLQCERKYRQIVAACLSIKKVNDMPFAQLENTVNDLLQPAEWIFIEDRPRELVG